MNKKTIIIGIIALVLVIILAIVLIPGNKNPDIPATEPVATEPLPTIEYYEDAALVNGMNVSIAPSNTIQMNDGKVVYQDGTEKTWLTLYKEEESLPIEKKSFYFQNGTTLTNAFNANDTVASIIIPEGVVSLEKCFNTNFIAMDIKLPETLESFVDSFDKVHDVSLSSDNTGKIHVKDNVLYTDAGATLLMYPGWLKNEEFAVPDGVKIIAQEAITNNPYLKKIVLNKELETIELRGIASCANVTEIVMTDSLKSVNSAFSKMFMLESLFIPKDCVLLGVNFMQCPKLILSVDTANSNYTLENGVLFNKDKTTLIRYSETKEDKKYSIPESVTTIGASAFAFNKHLETLTINEGVTTVGTYFAECNALTTVNLPASLQSLKTMTFTRLPKLSAINYAGTEEEWLYVEKGIDWMISSIEYRISYSDGSTGYKGTA